jgi:hypothetical protein
MTTLRIVNNTSFPIVSVVLDGVERITTCNFGILVGSFADYDVTANQQHTWTAFNGGYNTSMPSCPKVQHESWGPLSFNRPAGVFTQTLTNRPLSAYVNTDYGYAYSCWEATYTDGANTRIARLRLNDDGSWAFREFYNLSGQVTRQGTGTSWNETSRTIDFRISYSLVAPTVTWAARYNVYGGHSIWNGVNVLTGATTGELLYLRQRTSTGVPTNCP